MILPLTHEKVDILESELNKQEREFGNEEEANFGDDPIRPVGFSVAWTIICSLVVAAGMGLMVWAYDSLTALEHVENPERALEHIVSRSMDLELSWTQSAKWEQTLYEVLSGEDDPLLQVGKWYDELTQESMDPLTSLYAGVLEAEAGQLDRMRERMKTWDDRSELLSFFQSLLETAYLKKKSKPEDIIVLQSRLAEEVPDNWFYAQLAVQLANQAGDASFKDVTQGNLRSRIDELLLRNRALMFAEIGGVVVSLIALCILLWRRFRGGQEYLVVGDAVLPPPWVGGDGFAVLMRGGAMTLLLLTGLGTLLGAYFSFIDRNLNPKFMELMSSMILYAPIPFLLYVSLLRPEGRSLTQVFGLRIRSGKAWTFLLTILSLFACGMLGDWVISFAGQSIGHTIHWTEWFNDSLVWGGTSDLTILFLEVSVLAPLFEEVIFRGIVFGSLRRRFGWLLSALVSATIFAFVHGYGVIGFSAVWWSGFLWAWAYEKTGSLLPGILAHALNNFVFLGTLLIVFR